MNTELVTTKEGTLLPAEVEAKQAVAEAQGLLSVQYFPVIKTEDEYKQNGEQVAALKDAGKALEAKRVAITGPINASLKAINDLFRGPAEAIKTGIDARRNPMDAWQRELDRKRRAAEEAARQERERLAREAEERRLAAEAEFRRQEEEARQAQEAANAAATEDDPIAAFLAEEAAAQAELDRSTALETLKETIREEHRVEAAPIAPEVPVTTATGTRVNRPWVWEETNFAEVPDRYKMLNEKLINAEVKALKEKAAIPGLLIFQDLRVR